ncbi:hypothetical protein ACVBEE_02840 [Acinetobacter sp. ANC 3781]
MSTAVAKQHILQSVDWSRFDLEGWLQQFGAWLYTSTSSSGRTLNPIAVAMDNAVKTKKSKKINTDQQLQIIADYLTGDYIPPKPRKTKMTCEIDDNEARAVQRLVLDLQGQSEVLDDWMDAIISRYFYSCSWSEMVTDERSQLDARMDVKCGLAALHSRYGFIVYFK